MTMATCLRWNREEVRARIGRKDDLKHPDYMQFLFPRDKGKGGEAPEPMPTEDWMLAQANVLLIAGFDPITNELVAVLYYLTRNPDKLGRLSDEIRSAFKSYGDINADALQTFKYLQAVIEEGLRIHTNAAFGLPRISPGATVDGHYVPEGVRAADPGSIMCILRNKLTSVTTGCGPNMPLCNHP